MMMAVLMTNAKLVTLLVAIMMMKCMHAINVHLALIAPVTI